MVVTGASAGIGRAVVREFAKDGAHIGLIARGRDGLEAARQEVEAAGGRALVLPADVSDAAEVDRAAERVEREFGPIDIWVNDAMAAVFSPVKKMTAEDFRRVTEVTYLGFVHGTLAALRTMLPRDRGMIVQVGSALAYRGIPLQAAYCGAKHAIHGFTESLRCELIHDNSNVKVTMVNMPAANTPQHSWAKNRMPRRPQPVPPIYQPEVCALRRSLRRPPLSPRVERRPHHRCGNRGECRHAGSRRLLSRQDRLRIPDDGRTGFSDPAEQSVRTVARGLGRPWPVR